MSSENSAEQTKESEREYFKKLILSELEKVSASPLVDLSLALNKWLETGAHKGNGNQKFADEIGALMTSGDPLEAAFQFVSKKSPIPQTGSTNRSLREARTLLTLSFSPDE